MKNTYKFVLYHVLFWVGYILYLISYDLLLWPDLKIYLLSEIIFDFTLLLIFYSIYFSLLHYYFYKKGIPYMVAICLLVYYIAGACSNFLNRNTQLYAPEVKPDYSYSNIDMVLFYSDKYIAVTIWAIVFFFIYVNEDIKNKYLKLYKEEKQLTQIIDSFNENKSIINKEFDEIIDTKENISQSLKSAMIGMKNFVNYHLNSSIFSCVKLSQEIKNTLIFIELNQKQYSNIKTNINISDYIPVIEVPTMCLLTLIENALKHGDLKSEPLYINIMPSLKGFQVEIKNKIAIHQAISSNIGLENLRNRLEIYLKGKYQFNYWKDDLYFYSQIEFFI